jgi:hypothetical protein
LKTIIFQITGVTPLLLHSPQGMMDPEPATATAKRKPTPTDEAEKAAYRLPSGQLYLPGSSFRGAMVDGVKGRRFSGSKVGANTLLKGTVFVPLSDEFYPLYHPETLEPLHDYEIDSRTAVVQRARILRNRPKLMQWGCRAVFEYDEEIIRPENLLEALSLGGRTVGVGDYRPSCSGPFGRFTAEWLK